MISKAGFLEKTAKGGIAFNRDKFVREIMGDYKGINSEDIFSKYKRCYEIYLKLRDFIEINQVTLPPEKIRKKITDDDLYWIEFDLASGLEFLDSAVLSISEEEFRNIFLTNKV